MSHKNLALLGLIVGLSAGVPAYAASYTSLLQIQGWTATNSNQWAPVSFAWGPSAPSAGQGVSETLTIAKGPDTSDGALMEAARANHLFPSAKLQFALLVGSTEEVMTVDVQMTNVKVYAVQINGSDSVGPQTLLTLKFSSVLYTFQPVLPTGQKAGPPITYSATF